MSVHEAGVSDGVDAAEAAVVTLDSGAHVTVRDGGDASVTRDGGGDARASADAGPDSGVDAGSDGGLADGGAFVIDAGPLPPGAVVDLGRVYDFDVEGSVLVADRNSSSFVRCTLPACTDVAPIPIIRPSGSTRGVALGNGKVYYPQESTTAPDLWRADLDGTNATMAARHDVMSITGDGLALHGGHRGVFLVELTQYPGPGEFWVQTISTTLSPARTDRIGHPTRYIHTNGDARLHFDPAYRLSPSPTPFAPARIVVHTASKTRDLPVPAAYTVYPPSNAPYGVGVSPTVVGGAPVASPIAVYADAAGEIWSCPIDAQCDAWSPTGVTANRGFALDDTYLYVATTTGLGRCPLADAAAGVCAPEPLVDVPAAAPIVIAPPWIYFVSGRTPTDRSLIARTPLNP